MNDELVFSLVCLAPFLLGMALLALVVWVVKSGAERARVGRLEAEVQRLKNAHVALLGRLAALEAGVAAPVAAAVTHAAVTHAPAAQVPATPTTPTTPTTTAPAPAPSAAPVSSPAATAAPMAAPTTPRARPVAPTHLGQGSAPPVPPAAPPGATPTLPPPTPTPTGASWEQWIGVRGAAALGAGVLALAAAYFFKYSIDHGWISPTLRVVLGTLVGVGCIAAAEGPLRRDHRTLGNWLAGAGVAILYLAFWAASALYQLVPNGAAFVLMGAVTATACVASVRRRSRAIAGLGLLGGFMTPLLLSTGSDRPVALFAYLMLLDGALLFVSRMRRWPALPLLALGGTTLYQLAWIAGRMDPGRLWLGIAIVSVFAALFALGSRPAPREEGGASGDLAWRVSRALGVLSPFAFGVYFAARADLAAQLPAVAAMTALLLAGACALAWRERMPWLPVAGASFCLAALAGALLSRAPTDESLPALLGHLGASLAVALGFAELARRLGRGVAPTDATRTDDEDVGAGADPSSGLPSPFAFPALLLAGGGLALLGATAVGTAGLSAWPWLGAFAVLGLVLYRLSRHDGLSWIQVPAAAGLALALGALHVARALDPGFPPVGTYLAVTVLFALGASAAALVGGTTARRAADHAAALGALLTATHLFVLPRLVPATPALWLGASLLLGVLAAFSAARLRHGGWLVPATAVTALGAWVFAALRPEALAAPRETFALVAGSLLVLALAPFWLGGALRRDLNAFRAAALAPVLFFPALLTLWNEAIPMGAEVRGLLPAGLGVLAFAIALGARTVGAPGEARRRSAFVWPAVVALGFVTVAVPLQLENEWVTIAWALLGTASLALYRRVEHKGLELFGLALLGTVTLRLVLNPYVLDYHAPSGMPFLNWLAYAYLVPVVALLVGHALLRDVEVPRRSSLERGLFGTQVRVLAPALVLAAIAVGFVWINLAIIDAYSTGRELVLPVDRLPARDLSLSLAWAVYGVTLLCLGMWRSARGLRALALALLMLTSAKVFLYDLGHLHDLYRVASLVGLALSLILVSFAYQRFVFRGAPTPEMAR